MERSNDYKPSKGLRMVTQNKKLTSGILITGYIVFVVVMYFVLDKDLEKTAYVAEILGGVFIIAGLVVSVLQYTASCVENSILRDQEKKIKAAEMADKFQAEIIPLSNVLARAYKESGMGKLLLDQIEKSELMLFNKDEVENVLKEAKTDERKVFVGLCMGDLLQNGTITSASAKNVSKEQQLNAEKNINKCINELSNKLEYFAICFNSGIADEDTVYQSLHSVYFLCVHMLYIFIFAHNTTESDRLYSNVSALYIRWKTRHDELVRKEKQEVLNMKKNVQNKIVVNAKK